MVGAGSLPMEREMKLLLQSTRGVSVLVVYHMDRFVMPLVIAAALGLAGAMLGYPVHG
jgi:hypothetical protein